MIQTSDVTRGQHTRTADQTRVSTPDGSGRNRSNAWLCFADEPGQVLRPPKAQTWSRRGHTPRVTVRGGDSPDPSTRLVTGFAGPLEASPSSPFPGHCTRSTLKQDRPVAYGDQTLDSLSQSAGIDRLANAQDNLRQQFTRGTAWRWSSTSNRKITETIEPGEVSWIEAQTGRQRTEGW